MSRGLGGSAYPTVVVALALAFVVVLSPVVSGAHCPALAARRAGAMWAFAAFGWYVLRRAYRRRCCRCCSICPDTRSAPDH